MLEICKTFQKDIYCRTPSWIPYADSIDLMLNFKSAIEIKAALMQAPSVGEVVSSGGRAAVGTMLQDYSVGFYGQPYLNVEWCVPPVSLRPSYTLPCWRNQHYSQRVSWAAVLGGHRICTPRFVPTVGQQGPSLYVLQRHAQLASII